MTNGKDNQPTIASFLDLLEHQLQERDYDSLLEVLRVVAEHISPEQRYDVLVAINELTSAIDAKVNPVTSMPPSTPVHWLADASGQAASASAHEISTKSAGCSHSLPSQIADAASDGMARARTAIANAIMIFFMFPIPPSLGYYIRCKPI